MANFWTQIFRAELIYILILLGIATDGYAQNSANCRGKGWEIFGDKGTGSDVCKTAQDLMDNCKPGSGQLAIIKPRSANLPWYKASDILQLPDCACTRVMYNVLSVCAACQTSNLTHTPSHKFPSVSDYAGSSCQNFFETNGTLQLLPTNEDDGIEWPNMAPQWSQSLTDETFNIQKAEDFISQTSSPNTTTTTGEVAPTEMPTPTASVSAGSSNSSSSSGPNVGAIAGGVVGGLAFLGAIIALVFFLRHRKRRSRDVAPSDEFLKPEYYATPPLLSATGDRRESEYRDDGAEDEIMPAIPHRLSWAGGLVATRRTEDEEGDMLPPFTQGTYIGPSPHEKGVPARRRTDESDGTMRTTTTNTVLLSSPTRSGPSEHV